MISHTYHGRRVIYILRNNIQHLGHFPTAGYLCLIVMNAASALMVVAAQTPEPRSLEKMNRIAEKRRIE
jgi:hypothetical protein